LIYEIKQNLPKTIHFKPGLVHLFKPLIRVMRFLSSNKLNFTQVQDL